MANTATKTAFELIEEAPSELASQEQRNREPRYLFYAGDEAGTVEPGGLQVQSPCVPGKMVWRCAVTPVVSAPVRSRAVDIPEGRELDGTRNDRGLASYLLPAGPEAEMLIAEYGAADPQQWQKRWGLVELTEWRGMSPREVAKLNLTTFFFPEWPYVPTTNKEVLAILTAKREEIAAQKQDDFQARLLVTADQMIAAVNQAQTHQTRLIQQGNIRITYPDSNDAHKPGFDAKDERFSIRSGAQLAVNSLRGNQSDAAQGLKDALVEVLGKQQQAASLDPATIAAIVAATVQALQAKPEEAKSEAKNDTPKEPVRPGVPNLQKRN